MHARFRLYRRAGGAFYFHDSTTGKQASLRTRDRREATRLVEAKNEAVQQPLLNRALARAYLAGQDARMLTRTWREVFAQFAERGRETSRERSRRAAMSRSFDPIREKLLIETVAEDFLAALKRGGAATNNYLRRYHNLALDLGWLLTPVLPKKAWPRIESKTRRAITKVEFDQILAAERNEERRHYYELLWETGAAQTDAALLSAENIDQAGETLVYSRMKLRSDHEPCRLGITARLRTLLKSLPSSGLLFPNIASTKPNDRSAEFCRRCRLLGFSGISLHSFRYAWAERACAAGYPERFAQAALGHSSKAVHRAYARGAKVTCPPLDEFEKPEPGRVIPFPPALLHQG